MGLILITGGVRSGKSSFAQQLAESFKDKDITFIATLIPKDKEMEIRVEKHKQSRPKSWKTIIAEDPQKISAHLQTKAAKDVILIDCLTILLSNLCLKEKSFFEENHQKWEKTKTNILNKIYSLGETIALKESTTIMVTNEVGWSIIPQSLTARRFQDLQGKANQLMASLAESVYIVICGIPLKLKGGKNCCFSL